MKKKEKEHYSKRKYAYISLKKRMKLVNMVIEEGYAVTRASKKLCIKLCTARVILSKYRKTGTFPMKKTTKQTIQTMKPIHEIPQQIRIFVQNKNQSNKVQQVYQENSNVLKKQQVEFAPFLGYYNQYYVFPSLPNM